MDDGARRAAEDEMESKIQNVRVIERSIDRLTLAVSNLLAAGDIVLDDFAEHARQRVVALLGTPNPETNSQVCYENTH